MTVTPALLLFMLVVAVLAAAFVHRVRRAPCVVVVVVALFGGLCSGVLFGWAFCHLVSSVMRAWW